jgi:hypothetical protein
VQDRKAKHYRREAERCRKLAKTMPESDAKQHMLDVSRQYDRLADEAEANPG